MINESIDGVRVKVWERLNFPLSSKSITLIFDMAAQETAEIIATGTWITHRHGGADANPPAGNGIPMNGSGWPEGCLVASVVLDGQVRPSFSDYWKSDTKVLSAPGPGRLLLGPLDDNFGDNDGALTVSVAVYQHAGGTELWTLEAASIGLSRKRPFK